MSIPSSNALSEFREHLNIQENSLVEANIKYKEKFDFQKKKLFTSKKKKVCYLYLKMEKIL